MGDEVSFRTDSQEVYFRGKGTALVSGSDMLRLLERSLHCSGSIEGWLLPDQKRTERNLERAIENLCFYFASFVATNDRSSLFIDCTAL